MKRLRFCKKMREKIDYELELQIKSHIDTDTDNILNSLIPTALKQHWYKPRISYEPDIMIEKCFKNKSVVSFKELEERASKIEKRTKHQIIFCLDPVSIDLAVDRLQNITFDGYTFTRND